jgi:beta-N-acetylhexosaminidase
VTSNSLGQLILTGVPGTELDRETAELFRRVQPGGFILFGRNIKSAPQLRRLIDDLRAISKIEPIITIDQEGGRVSRLRMIGNEPPNAQQLREKGDVELVRQHGDITGRLLRLFGFNLDLCPVLDISFDDDADNSLRGRCYGKTVDEVIIMAGAFNDAMRKQGIASCGKHFPGYSAATLDAHHELPKIERTRKQLDEEELAVFRAFVGRDGPPGRPSDARFAQSARPAVEPYQQQSARAAVEPYQRIVDSMMICHGWYPTFEARKTPASLSRRIVTGLLREEFGFDGLIMTDDLDMGAILTGYRLDDTIRLCLDAGNDIMMLCHRVPEIETVHRILGTLPSDQIERAQQHVSEFKKNLSPPQPFSESAFREINAEIADLRTAVVGEEEAGRVERERQISPVERF